jgi:hypothetical protein
LISEDFAETGTEVAHPLDYSSALTREQQERFAVIESKKAEVINPLR